MNSFAILYFIIWWYQEVKIFCLVKSVGLRFKNKEAKPKRITIATGLTITVSPNRRHRRDYVRQFRWLRNTISW